MEMITIIGRRWFQKTYGNTYHSVVVLVDGEEIGREPFAYGYGDQYIQTAHELLVKAGKFTGDYSAFYQDRMGENRGNYVITVSDVARQKDL